jgi:hypothetical protein
LTLFFLIVNIKNLKQVLKEIAVIIMVVITMADYQFGQILQTICDKWFQSAKVTAERNGFNTTATYFST